MDVLSASPSVAGGSHHHNHHHHHSHRVLSDDANLESSENSINGWQSTKMNIHNNQSPRRALRDRQSTPSSSPFNKGKAKESEDVRTPRRLAASKALKQVMRNSAPPVSDFEMDDEASSSKSPSTSPTKGVSAFSSPSKSSATLLSSGSNGIIESRRKQLSPSPLPMSTRRSGTMSALSSPAVQQRQLSSDSTANDQIDLAELDQFKFKADSLDQTAILPRQPPNLPYDPTYLPLSPNGVDQVGHSIQLPAQNQIGASGKAAEAAKLGRGTNTQNKKILQGQEMENHIVSEVPGQKAIPWGLQATLLEKEKGGPRAKTKSGMIKRTAMREHRRAGIKTKGGMDSAEIIPLKLEDDVMSELDSPKLPVIQISEIAPEQIIAQEQEADKINGVSERNSISEEDTVLTEAVRPNEEESQKLIKPATPKKRGRRPRPTEVMSLSESPVKGLVEEISSSQETTSGNTRRPREAHKRLKLVGGYYRKPGRHREDIIDTPEVMTASAESTADSNQSDQAVTASTTAAAKSSSRATSFAPEDAMVLEEDSGLRSQTCSVAPLTAEDKMIDAMAEPVMRAVLGPSTSTNLRRMTVAAPTHGSPSKLKHASGEDANEEVNNEYCETCRGVGHFICCDGCPRSFHFACINPPLDVDELPSSVGDENDTWYCSVCKAAKSQRTKGKDSSRGVLSPLLRHVEGENPSIFSLPPDIRNYFKGVATANDGSYVNSSMLRPIKVNKFGLIDEREPLRLKDKNGKSILCYRCGESAMPPIRIGTNDDIAESPSKRGRPLREAAKIAIAAVTSNSSIPGSEAEESRNWRKIISCDFCNLHWHLDCLDPPLATMPSLARKWMCPNHIEHVMPSERTPKSVANSTTSHELPMPSRETIGPGKHYRMRVINDGQIDIIPDPLDIYTGPAHDGPEDGLAMLNGGTSGNGSNGSKQYGSGEKGWEEINLPAYKAYPTVFGNSNNIKLKYRIPEKVIRLDFWSKMELHREQVAESLLKRQSNQEREGLDMLALIASAAEQGITLNEQDQDAIHAQESISKSDAETLTKAIFAKRDEQDHPFVAPGHEPISTIRKSYIEGEYEREFEEIPSKEVQMTLSSTMQLDTDDANNSETDLDQMEALRRIIAYKGKDALLRFLLE